MDYVELRTHSAFSFGDGSASPEALDARAAELGYTSLGLTDGADLDGAIRFTLEAERVGLKPIIGVELEVDGHPTALLAADAAGYRNLATLTTLARAGHPIAEPASPSGDVRAPGSSPAAEPAGGRPGVSFDALASHAAGLWCLTDPATGELATLLRSRRHSEAVFQLDRWRSVFGARLAVEVQLHHVSGEESALAAGLIELAERGGVRWVATNDPRYLDAAGRLVHEMLVSNRAGVCVNRAASWGPPLPNGEWRLKSPREMEAFRSVRESS